MARWHGCWLVGLWLVLPVATWAQEPHRIPHAPEAINVSKANEPLRLTRPSGHSNSGTGGTDSSRSQASKNWTTPASLLFVLTLIAGGAYLIRRQNRRFPGLLPDDVVQVLGRRYIDQRQAIQLIRCGSKILVLANSTQHGLTTLAEITDPVEVEQITAQCLPGGHSVSSNRTDKLRTDPPGRSSPTPSMHAGAARHANGATGGGPHG